MHESFPGDFSDLGKHLRSCGHVAVRDSIGGPSFRPLAEIPPEILESEVERILKMLADQMIDVDLENCTIGEAYRFLTTDLMNADIESPRAPGWWTCYLYSDFHQRGEGEDEIARRCPD